MWVGYYIALAMDLTRIWSCKVTSHTTDHAVLFLSLGSKNNRKSMTFIPKKDNQIIEIMGGESKLPKRFEGEGYLLSKKQSY